MSKFHASVCDLFEDIYSFLSCTLKNEILSSTSLAHKEKIISGLLNFQKEYPEVHLQFKSVHQDADGRPDSVRYSPSSPVPYVDMNGGSPYKIPSFTAQNVEGENYDLCIIKDKSTNAENQSVGDSEDYISDEAKCLPDVAASDLYACEKSGYLDKKKRDSIKGWLNPFQKRWCAIQDGVMYYYEKSSDRKQRGSIVLLGYEARALSEDSKDGKKYNHCFELVCPGKRTYQFSASSETDLKQWVAAVEKNSKVTPSSKSCTREHSLSQNGHVASETEDIYEIVEDGDSGNQDPANKLLQALNENSDKNKSDVEDLVSTNQIFNYNEWYVGLWDCTGADQTELNFLRGDLIRIISKEYDSLSWWIGESQGKVGFVPKSYLMEAYEAY